MSNSVNDVDKLLRNIKTTNDLYFLSLHLLNHMTTKKHKYGSLPELAVILNESSLLNILLYFEGQTITIPTRSEMKDMLMMINLYYYHEILGYEFYDACDEVGFTGRKYNMERRYKNFKKYLEEVKLPDTSKVSDL